MKVYILHFYDWERDAMFATSMHRTKEDAERRIKEYHENLRKFIQIKEQELLLDNDYMIEFEYDIF